MMFRWKRNKTDWRQKWCPMGERAMLIPKVNVDPPRTEVNGLFAQSFRFYRQPQGKRGAFISGEGWRLAINSFFFRPSFPFISPSYIACLTLKWASFHYTLWKHQFLFELETPPRWREIFFVASAIFDCSNTSKRIGYPIRDALVINSLKWTKCYFRHPDLNIVNGGNVQNNPQSLDSKLMVPNSNR